MTADTIPSASRGSTDRWENEGGPVAPRRKPEPDGLQVELKRYGIVPVQLTVFDWGGYRYSNASDAIAAAKRSTLSA
jgi:hypothetical protein